MAKVLDINDIGLPEPTAMTIEVYDITKSNRNTLGFMKGQIVRHDVHKLAVKYAKLKATEYYKITQAIKSKYGLKVHFFIPEQLSEGTRTMYVGDRKIPIYTYDDGVPVYKNVEFSLIEE
ncbi:MAG: hypothetical protein PHX08_01775 [Lachnospiraceae bacterium]|nr:hypothetical protein [Lachnospiraceae bacterium]